VSTKKILKLLKKKLVYNIIIIPNSSSTKVKSCYIPFPLALIIIIFFIFNIYVFFGYSTQIWQLNAFRQDSMAKSNLISRLYAERHHVLPILEKNKTLSSELSQLVQEQTRLENTLSRIREKKGRSIFIASRGFFVRTEPYKLTSVSVTDGSVTALDILDHNLGELDNYIQVEKQAQNEFLNKMQSYEYGLDHMPSIWPVHSSIICDFGMRFHPIYHRYIAHLGLDIAASYGTPIAATADGVVSYAGWESGYGNLVKINHGNGLETRYGHNSRILVYVGEKVKKGQKIALAGATGDATGPHCHYEVRSHDTAINPVPYLRVH
jgi:murein DD-endopeptidase MepM/ murein hydrolase activator NlpD